MLCYYNAREVCAAGNVWERTVTAGEGRLASRLWPTALRSTRLQLSVRYDGIVFLGVGVLTDFPAGTTEMRAQMVAVDSLFSTGYTHKTTGVPGCRDLSSNLERGTVSCNFWIAGRGDGWASGSCCKHRARTWRRHTAVVSQRFYRVCPAHTAAPKLLYYYLWLVCACECICARSPAGFISFICI